MPVGMFVWVCMVKPKCVSGGGVGAVPFHGCVDGCLCSGPRCVGTRVSLRAQVGSTVSGFCGQPCTRPCEGMWNSDVSCCLNVLAVCISVYKGVCWPQGAGSSVEEVSLGT